MNQFKIPEDAELLAVPSELLYHAELMGKDIFDDVRDALMQFDDDFDKEGTIVFRTRENENGEPTYFIMEAYYGELLLDGMDEEKDIILVDVLETIDTDEYLDHVLMGNEIKYNKQRKRILMNFDFLEYEKEN